MSFQYKNAFKRIRPNWLLSENVFQNCEGLPSSQFGMDLVLLSYKACVPLLSPDLGVIPSQWIIDENSAQITPINMQNTL